MRFLILCLVCVTMTVTAQNITSVEYFINTDPGFGNASPVAISSSPNVQESFNVSLSGVQEGLNVVYFRARSSDGKWSLTNAVPFYHVQSSTASALADLEYFIDVDPGFGLGTPVSLPQSSNVNGFTFNVDLTSVPDGVHVLYLRGKTADGEWSITNVSSFTKTSPNGVASVTDASSLVQIYPNPSYGEFSIKTKEGFTPVSAEITDIQGKTVKRFETNGLSTLNCDGIQSGRYYIKVITDKGIIVKPFIIGK